MTSVDVTPTVSPSTLALATQGSYLNRRGQRVNIYGEVEEGTAEYIQGFRFYGSGMQFFRADGRHQVEENFPTDLVQVMDPEDVEQVEGFNSERLWIAPHTRESSTLFLDLAKDPSFTIKPDTQYLNRMGFMVDICDVRHAEDQGRDIYQDAFGMVFDRLGRVFGDLPSMLDIGYLVTQIHFPTKFETDAVIETEKSAVPAEDVGAMTKEFFDLILQARELGAKIGWDFGFHLFQRPSGIFGP